MYKLKECPICQSTKSVIYYKDIVLAYCKKCQIIWQYKISQAAVIKKYDKYYLLKYTTLSTYYPLIIGRIFLIDTIKHFIFNNQKVSLLDIGCNDCGLLHLLQKTNNFSYLGGVEINKNVKYLNSNLPIYTSIFKVKKQIDILTFFDSFEHFIDINKVLNHICKYINPKILIISVPNCFYTKQNIKHIQKWHHYRPNEHIYYFNKYSLTKFLAKFDYSLIFDTFVETLIRNKIPEKNILTGVFEKIIRK